MHGIAYDAILKRYLKTCFFFVKKDKEKLDQIFRNFGTVTQKIFLLINCEENLK